MCDSSFHSSSIQVLDGSRGLELVQTDRTRFDPSHRIYLVYGSLFPLETDIFAIYIVTPCAQDKDIGSVRSVTSVLYSEAVDVWETRLGQFLMSDLKDVLGRVESGRAITYSNTSSYN
jgi:hypothetical protein